VPVVVDTVAWVRLEGGRILCARPRGKDIFYIPGRARVPRVDQLLFDDLKAAGQLL
jgi:hypothetical protein